MLPPPDTSVQRQSGYDEQEHSQEGKRQAGEVDESAGGSLLCLGNTYPFLSPSLFVIPPHSRRDLR